MCADNSLGRNVKITKPVVRRVGEAKDANKTNKIGRVFV